MTSQLNFQMESANSISNIIRNIVAQVQDTTIIIGKIEGSFVSERQIAVLLDCAERLEIFDLETLDTPTDSVIAEEVNVEAETRARRKLVADQIKSITAQISAADPTKRIHLNLDLGKLLSERAKLDKLIKQFDKL